MASDTTCWLRMLMLTVIRAMTWVSPKQQTQDGVGAVCVCVCWGVSFVASLINTGLLILWVTSLACRRRVRDAENIWLYWVTLFIDNILSLYYAVLLKLCGVTVHTRQPIPLVKSTVNNHHIFDLTWFYLFTMFIDAIKTKLCISGLDACNVIYSTFAQITHCSVHIIVFFSFVHICS